VSHAPEWIIHPREANMSRLYDPLSNWSKLALVERHNSPDVWSITGPIEIMQAFGPGKGSVLYRDGQQITAGKVSEISARSETLVEGRKKQVMTVSFASDLKPVGDKVIFPDPAHNLTSAISKFTSSYDLRTGAVETLMLGYIRSHAGNLAQLDRQVPRLRLPTDLARGGSTQVSARLDTLGVLLGTLAEAGGLRIRTLHTEDGGGGWIDLVIDATADLSADVRFGTEESAATGLISDWEYNIKMPTTTRAIVALGGELADREFLQLDSLAAETLWGVSVETLVDQRHIAPTSTDKLAEATRAANEALEAGAAPTTVKFTPTLGPDLEYRSDVRVGDIVGYDLPGLDPAKDRIREATTVVTVEDNEPLEKVSVVVGTPDAPTTRTQQQVARALRAVNIIQRSR
jgi:hypothetical protein